MAVPYIERSLCIGCGLCEDTCPEVFELGPDIIALVKDGADCEEADCCEEAIENCPVEAISWKD